MAYLFAAGIGNNKKHAYVILCFSHTKVSRSCQSVTEMLLYTTEKLEIFEVFAFAVENCSQKNLLQTQRNCRQVVKHNL